MIIQNFMQLNSQKNCDQSQLSSSKGTQQLKKKIVLTNSQLYQLLSNADDFNQRIKQLNLKGIKQIEAETFEEALIYLGEAEKNLEYAASCGLTLDRYLITTTLKNLACVYQRMWQLGTCYDYMEALIFNLSSNLGDSNNFTLTEAIRNTDSEEYKKGSRIINNKLNIGLCHLQFSALSSQLGKHQEARKSVQRSLEEFEALSVYCHTYEMISKGKTSILLDQIRTCFHLDPSLNISKSLIQAKKGIESIRNHRYFFSFDTKLIEKLSMGDIMQISYTTVQEANKIIDIDWFVGQLGLTYLAIYISCCYFALATEIRLAHQQSNNQQQIHTQMTQAKIHHLHSITMASQIVLIQSNFLTHIVKSFKNNFSIDLVHQNFEIQEEKLRNFVIEWDQKDKEHEEELQKYDKIETYHKNSQKKSDSDGTKGHTIQSDLNDNIENSHKNKMQKIKKQNSRKTSIADGKLLKTNIKKVKSKKNFNVVQQKKQKSIISSRSSENKKQLSKQPIKLKTKNERINEQYFLNTKIYKQRSKSRNILGSPKNKIKRKPESSNSRPKLKLKTIKSPLKQKQ